MAIDALLQRLRANGAMQVLCWDLPGAIADLIGRKLAGRALLHVGRHYALPGAAVSVRAPDAMRREALAQGIGRLRVQAAGRRVPAHRS